MTDRRRVLGPADAVPFSLDNIKPAEIEQKSLDVGSIFVKTGVVENANGSAYLELDDIKIVAVVHGPRPMRGLFTTSAILNVDTKFLPVSLCDIESKSALVSSTQLTQYIRSASTTQSSSLQKNVSSYVHTSLLPSILVEKYPKSTIDVSISVLSSSNNTKTTVAAAVSCAGAALADSGLECTDIVTAGSVLLSDSSAVVCPSRAPTREIDAVVSYMAASKKIVGMWVEGGNVSETQMEEVFDKTEDMAREIRGVMHGVLLEQ
ncbi:Exosome complex component mtr3 [Yarrowia sp. C11]|nr:Exosome complex component mtr3 [Yarrowia sp. E02]KAG5372058.1 Exosome complex component mtr3 [Yarrowia sp. C11]